MTRLARVRRLLAPRMGALLQGVAVRLHGRPWLQTRLLSAPRRIAERDLRSGLFLAFSWPLTRDLDSQLEVATVGGRMLVDTADLIGRVLAVSGEWEPHITEVFKHQLHPGDVCIDVGAHIGYYTLVASSIVGTRGHVHAIEPSPSRHRRLVENLRRNNVENVTAWNVAAGQARGSSILYERRADNTGSSSLSPRVLDSSPPSSGDYTAVEVPVARIDETVPGEVFERVRVVKVDVEGHEAEVLRGLEGILARRTPLAVFVEISPELSLEDPVEFVHRLCSSHDFTPYLLTNEYTASGYFPSRLMPPLRVDRVPAERCDLLLLRGNER